MSLSGDVLSSSSIYCPDPGRVVPVGVLLCRFMGADIADDDAGRVHLERNH